MSTATIQELVAEKIKTLYTVSQELEELFSGRHYTPDGHMIGSIGRPLLLPVMVLSYLKHRRKHMMPVQRMAD